jgi:uncharacterized protein YndB with AHSA1/START domain
MSLPTSAMVTVDIAASPETIYDLVSDITRMGEWSPECTGGEWLDAPGEVGSRFRGRNRRGPARWSTTARVLVADRPREFSFATMHRGTPATRWTYSFEGDGSTTRVTETFEAVSTPWLIALAERWLIRGRQAQLEAGLAHTLAAVKTAAEEAAMHDRRGVPAHRHRPEAAGGSSPASGG